jgi:hypothetical protein
MRRYISKFSLIVALFVSSAAFGQSHFVSKGALVGFANTFSDNTDYKLALFMGEYARSFNKTRKTDFAGWYAQPQFNLVKATNTPEGSLDYEFGLNLGIRNFIECNPGWYLYQMLGSGPHFFSANLTRQARGFIFSDNLAFGSFIRLKKSCFLNVQAGIRHISNANIHLPNRGVNTYNIMLGLSGVMHHVSEAGR